MALTKEEVSIRLGVDAKGVTKGLDSTSGYFAKWRKKETAAEREYTNFWAGELDKRDKLSIEQAARNNRARALWRERGAKRELEIAKQNAAALAQIEAENAPASGGIGANGGTKDDSFGGSAVSAIGNKAVSLLKANLFVAVIGLFKEVIPSAKEFWDFVYGTDDATMEKSKQANENIRGMLKSVRDSQRSLKETQEASEFDRMSPEQKWKNTEAKRKLADEEVRRAQADLAHAEKVKEANKHLRSSSSEVKVGLLGGIFGTTVQSGQDNQAYLNVLKIQADAQSALNKAKEGQIKAQDLEVKTRDEFFASSNTRRPDFVPLDVVGVATKRREIAAIDAQMKAGGMSPQDHSRELKNREVAVNQINQTISSRQAENLEIIKTMLAAEIEARATGKYIQPVAVVDVKDKGGK